MNSKHSENSSKRMVTRTMKPRGEKRHRVPPRKNYPTKPRDLDKREKLKTSRSRTSEFAHLYAYDFSDLTHDLQPNQDQELPNQDQELPEDTRGEWFGSNTNDDQLWEDFYLDTGSPEYKKWLAKCDKPSVSASVPPTDEEKKVAALRSIGHHGCICEMCTTFGSGEYWCIYALP